MRQARTAESQRNDLHHTIHSSHSPDPVLCIRIGSMITIISVVLVPVSIARTIVSNPNTLKLNERQHAVQHFC